jgi:ADP-ribose pyrophosphatase YjhB (NUDIX family)
MLFSEGLFTGGRVSDSKANKFLERMREIQALVQTERHYALDDFQKARCQKIMDIIAVIISDETGIALPALAQSFKGQLGYATPKVDVRAAIFQEDKLLLVRERLDGGWTMPGGWADVGDTPSKAAEREAWEEAGFHVRARKLVGVYDANRVNPLELFHAFKIVFLCDILGGEAQTSIETSEVKFFSQGEIPANFSGERTASRHVRDAFNALRMPDCPSVFE